jgi:hypothetical protein
LGAAALAGFGAAALEAAAGFAAEVVDLGAEALGFAAGFVAAFAGLLAMFLADPWECVVDADPEPAHTPR